MKKIMIAAAAIAMAAAFTACGDDSSSGSSSKACVYKSNGVITNCVGDAGMVEEMCEGENAELVDACPAGFTAECPTGDDMFGTNYYYIEGVQCTSFNAQ